MLALLHAATMRHIYRRPEAGGRCTLFRHSQYVFVTDGRYAFVLVIFWPAPSIGVPAALFLDEMAEMFCFEEEALLVAVSVVVRGERLG
jgi:hypothetical protein